MSTIRATGRCLCGAVQYEVSGPLRPVVYCHCRQCQKTSGNFVAATACAAEDLVVWAANGLRWYASSDIAERGFCNECGSNLFWRPNDGSHISIMAGTINGSTGLQASAHIFVESASDFLTIADGLPQHAQRGSANTTTLKK